MAKVVGEISKSETPVLVSVIDWTVDEVQDILQRDGDACCSRNFVFCGGEWTLEIMRSVESRMIQCLCISIERHSTSSHKNHVDYKLFKTNSDGAKHLLLQHKHKADEGTWDYWVVFDLSGRNFSWSEETVFHLKAVCTLECFECTGSEDPRHIPGRRRHVQEFIIDGRGGDLIINVKGKLFKAHKGVMRERSPVFDAMLRHVTAERKTGEVNISDCEPAAFDIFLEYLHSNILEIDSMDTVYSLYPITDKYEVSGAKAECVRYMLENLNLETFCDIVTLSLHHEDSELSERANQFFEVNSEAITRTHQWRAFRAKNPDAANGFLTRVGS